MDNLRHQLGVPVAWSMDRIVPLYLVWAKHNLQTVNRRAVPNLKKGMSFLLSDRPDRPGDLYGGVYVFVNGTQCQYAFNGGKKFGGKEKISLA